MNGQLKLLFTKAKLNFAVLAAILIIAVVGKFINPELTNSIFVTADQLVSDLYLVFIAITLGAFVPNFKTVVFGATGVFIVAIIAMMATIKTPVAPKTTVLKFGTNAPKVMAIKTK